MIARVAMMVTDDNGNMMMSAMREALIVPAASEQRAARLEENMAGTMSKLSELTEGAAEEMREQSVAGLEKWA